MNKRIDNTYGISTLLDQYFNYIDLGASMNLKIIALSTLIPFTYAVTINAMSNAEKKGAIEALNRSVEYIKSINEINFEEIRAFPQDGRLHAIVCLMNAKCEASQAHSEAVKRYQANDIPKISDPKMNILFTISRKIAPLSEAIASLYVINKINEGIKLINQK